MVDRELREQAFQRVGFQARGRSPQVAHADRYEHSARQALTWPVGGPPLAKAPAEIITSACAVA